MIFKKKHEDYFFSHFAMTKRQRSGFFGLVFLIVLTELIIQFYPLNKEESKQSFTPEEEALALQFNDYETKGEKEVKSISFKNFNPNALNEEGFMLLGFTQKQANSLVKYRYLVGGNFTSIEQFGKAYVISDKKLEQLRPYIQLSPVNREVRKKGAYHTKEKREIKKRLKPFFINRLNQAQIENLGFSEKQASTILNFKNSLPNKKFKNIEQFGQCFVVNDYMINKLRPYIRFEKNIESKQEVKINKQGLNPNTMSAEDWERLGFDSDTANNIVKYREFKGGFKSLEEVKACKYISEQQFDKIRDLLIFYRPLRLQ